MNEIPDELLQQVLGNPTSVANINELLKSSGVETPFETLPVEQQKSILGQIIAQQEAAQNQGGGIQVNLEALGVAKEAFDEIWSTSQQEAEGDIGKLTEILRTKLTAAGAPADQIEAIVSQFPSNEA